MSSHRFKIGDIVAVRPSVSRNMPGGLYEVVKQLPGSGEPEYRIKSVPWNGRKVAQLTVSNLHPRPL
jgi:hypothetical protein